MADTERVAGSWRTSCGIVVWSGSPREIALAPLGVYGPALRPALRDWRRFLLVAAAMAVAIETAQLLGSLAEGFTYRVTDVDDALLNAAGALGGARFRWAGRRLQIT